MKKPFLPVRFLSVAACVVSALALAGCASTSGTSDGSAAAGTAPAGPPAAGVASKFKADDGRTIDIGKATVSDAGLSFKNPHLEKCWIADGFKFTGFDTLYIAPTTSTAKYQPDEERLHQLAMENLPLELMRKLGTKGIFPSVVTRESDIKAGGRTLKLENTLVEYAKGGGAARYFAGLYGGGQPKLRVLGRMTDGTRTVFSFEARRSGVSAGARMTGAFMKDEDIQLEDIRSMVLDLSDFMAAQAGKYQPKN